MASTFYLCYENFVGAIFSVTDGGQTFRCTLPSEVIDGLQTLPSIKTPQEYRAVAKQLEAQVRMAVETRLRHANLTGDIKLTWERNPLTGVGHISAL